MANNYDLNTPVTATIERHRDNRVAMIVGGIVAVVAILAAVFYFTNQNLTQTQAQTQAATDQSTLAAQQSANAAQQANAMAANANTQAQVAGAQAAGNAAVAQAANANANVPATPMTPVQPNTGDSSANNSSNYIALTPPSRRTTGAAVFRFGFSSG